MTCKGRGGGRKTETWSSTSILGVRVKGHLYWGLLNVPKKLGHDGDIHNYNWDIPKWNV